MKKLLPLFLTLLALTSYSQNSVQSSVFDAKNGLPLEMATVRLLKATDSTLVAGGRTSETGTFILKGIKQGNYTLKVTMLGYSDFSSKVTVGRKNLIIKPIELNESAHMLKELNVTGNAAQMVVKGDTTEFNATAFKMDNNSVVEDLLKRLPGVQVSSDGKITVNGQEIKKVRVNGKKFFSDDVEMATKNIPADMIDKIQVLDQKSDMAQLTGFEDNDTERIINLTFKSSRRRGTFGNITGGGGLDLNDQFRYDGNMFLNMMDGDSQTALTGGGNNTNTTRSTRGRGAFSNNSGITTMQNFGLNNNSQINPKLTFGGNISFNHTFNETISKSNRQSYLVDSTYFNNSSTTSHNELYSGNINLELEWKPDTLNTFLFQPGISYNRSFSDSRNDYSNLTDTTLTSNGFNQNFGNGNSFSGNFGILYSHKFRSKPGRTLTFHFQTSVSQSNSVNNNYAKSFVRADSTLIDQQTKNESNSHSISLRTSYVEPLWNRNNLLETVLNLSTSVNMSDKNQYNRDAFGNYSILDSTYSNNFENRFYSETLELNYRYVDTMYNLMLGVRGAPSQSYSYRLYQNGASDYTPREVFNFAPTARFQYKFTKKKFMRIDYRGVTTQPSVGQLQPVKNNSNPMFLSVGNPELNPEFYHSLRMMYTSFNDSTFSSFSAFLFGQLSKDALVTNSIYDATGRQYSQTVNSTEMPYSVNANVMYNLPLIQKRLHFNTNTTAGLNQRYGYSSRGLNAQLLNSDSLPLGNLSSTMRYNAGEALSLTYTSDLIEIGLRGSYQYSYTVNNLNTNPAITNDWSYGGNVVLHLPYNFNLSSDINYTTMQGYATSPQNQLIWNASVDKTLFDNKGVISLKLNDILHQRLNIRQTIGDNYIQYNSYNTLTSYFLLSFSYKINDFKGQGRNPAEKGPGFRHFGPGNHPHFDGGSPAGGFHGNRVD